jgi:dTDP-glucose 4,6-dehydratase
MMKQKIVGVLLAVIMITGLAVAQSERGRVQCDEKTVFLTGAAGFIGSNFLKYMFDRYPNYRFLVLDALTYAGNMENIPEYIRRSPRFEFFYGSVTNYKLVDLLMSQSHYVVHFAAESHVTRSISDDTTFFETDVIGTRVMMTALVKYAKTVERYIHISTSEVLGTAEYEPMDENHPINPRSPYAAAKAGADRLVYAYWCTYDIPALIFRPFNNYGPQQHLEKCIPRFIYNALKGKPLTVHGDGSQVRDWVHTFDVSRALDLALHHKQFEKIKNQVLHVGSGVPVSILDIAKLVVKYLHLPEDLITFIGDRPGQVACHISSTQKTKELLGWEPHISFEQGIQDVIEWYKANQSRLERMETLMYVPIYTNDNVLELH